MGFVPSARQNISPKNQKERKKMPRVNFDTTGPFIKAKASKRRLKLFLWGDSGSGKTTLALHFPSPVVIDLEGGTELYGESFDFSVLPATDADEVTAAVDWLARNKHGYRTLIIDPITIYWEMLQKKWSDIFLNRNKAGKGYKHEFYEMQVKDWNTVKAEYKDFLRSLIILDMNVILIAREKTKYAEGSTMRAIGETFDAEKSTHYIFDTTLRLSVNGEGKHLGLTLKDRSNKLPPKKQGEWEVNYQVFEAAYGDILTKKAKIQPTATETKPASIVLPSKNETQSDIPDTPKDASLATHDQILQITLIGRRLGFSREDIANRIKEKYGKDELENLSAAVADEIIQALEAALPKSELEE